MLRRAPFSDNPNVGLRGQRAQQRILHAALQVFGEVGYHPAGIVRITEVAGCSRASFYQYFSSKEDVFRHLAGQVARQLTASAETIGATTADRAGWQELRAWIERHGEIYARYEPVFQAFQAAVESDDAVASGSDRILRRHVAGLRGKLAGATLPPGQVDGVIELLLQCLTRAPRVSDVLRTAVPSATLRQSRVRDALTDVVHRTLFGLDSAVNVRPSPKRRLPRVRLGAAVLDGLQADVQAARDLTGAGARTLSALLEAAHDVLIARGYHGTRVDDVTTAAGVSHGAFYRYFENKDHLVRLLAIRAMQRLSSAFDEIPDVAGDPGPASSAALRRWLRRYASTNATEAAIIRVWVDATADDPMLSLESAAALDWGRARMVRFLEPRGFGDVDTEALLLVVLIDAIGAHRRSPAAIEPAALIIERGLLGIGRR